MKTNRQILILGLGGVGRYLARQLTEAGHAITVIESNPDAIRRVEGELDARLILGDAMNSSCWLEAKARGKDYLIAVSDDDAVNILASLLADRFGIECKIARVRSRGLWTDGAVLTPEDLKIDFVIEPEKRVPVVYEADVAVAGPVEDPLLEAARRLDGHRQGQALAGGRAVERRRSPLAFEQAHDPLQTGHESQAGKDAQLDLGGAKDGPLGGQAKVGHQGQEQAAAHRYFS